MNTNLHQSRINAEAQRAQSPSIKIRKGLIKAADLLSDYIQEQDAKLEKCDPLDREGLIHKKLGAIAFFEKMMGCTIEQALEDIQKFKRAEAQLRLSAGSKGERTAL